jgi:hypothetical protein
VTNPPQPSQATPRDRRQLLLQSGATVNGIDFVQVDVDQTTLYVHFINEVTLYDTSASPPVNAFSGSNPVTIRGGEVITSVAVNPINPATDISDDTAGRPVLKLTVPAPGDFSTYTLSIQSSLIDPFFASAPFSFKANCPTTIDCATPAVVCPPGETQQATIDYTAKDFGSFVQALSEFSSARYPSWQERAEADLGMVLMEAMSAIADELSYYQDRIANESHIATATQRVSVLRQARLVDYEPTPATASTVLLQLDVDTTSGGTATTMCITDPVQVRAVGPNSQAIDFEVGDGLVDPASGLENSISYQVNSLWNRFVLGGPVAQLNLPPYWLDDSAICLRAGSTVINIGGHGHKLQPGQQLLLDTQGESSADPPVRELVAIYNPTDGSSAVIEWVDPLLGYEYTEVMLGAATQVDHDLSVTEIAGNLVPAVQGFRTTEWFWIPTTNDPPPSPPVPSESDPVYPAIVRLGPNSTPCDPVPVAKYTLSQSPLAWFPVGRTQATVQTDTVVTAWPEVVLQEVPYTGGPVDPNAGQWPFARWLLDARERDAAYTIAPEKYSPVLTSAGTTWYDYDGDAGSTINFGDGVFGVPPVPGSLFSVLYRVGGGQVGNVPAGAISTVVSSGTGPKVLSCTNPFVAAGGADEETNAQIASRAPQQFAAQPLRVVTPADYVSAVQSLPFVQQAGTTFRWTGSWLTVFTSANAVGSEEPSLDQLSQITELLDQRRLAGYESYVVPPQYVSIDLTLTVCADPGYFNSDVETAVLNRLRPGRVNGVVGFFDHSNWGFGQPLESSALYAAVQSCPGVAGVFDAQYRQRGVQLYPVELPDVLTVGSGWILRIDDDPSRPDAGSLTVNVAGGK